MSCKNCDEQSVVGHYRWKNANIEIKACQEHFSEMITALSALQEYDTKLLINKLKTLNELKNTEAIFGSEFSEWVFMNLSEIYVFYAKAMKQMENGKGQNN